MDDVAPCRFVARNIDPQAANAIHDDDVARRFGFSGALVPGVELFAGATSPLVAAGGQAWLARGRIHLRFRRPVYDGEQVDVALADGRLTLTGQDGEVRALGSAGWDDAPPDVSGYVDAPLPVVLPDAPSTGPFGSIEEQGTVEANRAYLEAIGEPLDLYRDRALAHPGLLLRLGNLLLMRNVALGPWVHTSSSCRMLGPARLPARMAVRGEVTELYSRSGHDGVRYQALVLADDAPVMTVEQTALYRLAAGP